MPARSTRWLFVIALLLLLPATACRPAPSIVERHARRPDLGELSRAHALRESRWALPPLPRHEISLPEEDHCLVETAAMNADEGKPLVVKASLVGSATGPADTSLELPAGSPWTDLRLEVPEGARTLVLESGNGPAPARWARPVFVCLRDVEQPSVNVLLVSLDTLRADRLGVYGDERGLTPGLDRFAAEGTRFAHAFAAYPNTIASHATMFTGLVPRDHHLGDGELVGIPRDAPTLARAFAEAGYRTAAFTENAYVASGFGFDAGFDRYHDGIDEDSSVRFPGQAARTFAGTLAWLAENDDAPFFVFAHTYAVHEPYNPARESVETVARSEGRQWKEGDPLLYRGQMNVDHNMGTERIPRSAFKLIRTLYDAEVLELDREFTRLLEGIAALGLADDTLVVVVSDHGESMNEHGTVGHGYGLHTEEIHTPLVLRLPGRVPAGRVIDGPVGLVDLGPTIAELAGIPDPFREEPASPASSLVPEILGQGSKGPAPRRPVFSEIGKSLIDCPQEPGEDLRLCLLDGVAVRLGEWSYIHTKANDRELLYHRAQDPGESRNRIDDAPAAVLDELRTLDEAYRAGLRVFDRDSGPPSTAPRPRSAAASAEVDEATRAKLRGLGYVE